MVHDLPPVIGQDVLEPASLEIEVMWFVDDVNVLSETFQVEITLKTVQ
jgi:hypothetical protein